jgi:hypothetical protein
MSGLHSQKYYTSIDDYSKKRTIEDWLPFIKFGTIVKDVGSYEKCVDIRNILGPMFNFVCYGPTYTMCIYDKK